MCSCVGGCLFYSVVLCVLVCVFCLFCSLLLCCLCFVFLLVCVVLLVRVCFVLLCVLCFSLLCVICCWWGDVLYVYMLFTLFVCMVLWFC